MLATYPQYSPQALVASPFGAGPFAPPGLHHGNPVFGYEPAFAGFASPSQAFAPFAASPSPYGNPYLQSPIPGQTPYAVAQQLVLALGQLAQQISVQSVVHQQIGSLLQQLTQQIQFALPGMPGQPYGQLVSPFIGSAPGVYSAFGPQSQPAWQAWGGPRTQTIQ